MSPPYPQYISKETTFHMAQVLRHLHAGVLQEQNNTEDHVTFLRPCHQLTKMCLFYVVRLEHIFTDVHKAVSKSLGPNPLE